MTINMSNDVNTNNGIMRTRFHQFTEQCDDETYKHQYEALMSLDVSYAFHQRLIARIASMKYDNNTFNAICENVYQYKQLIEKIDDFYDNHYDLINMNVFINSLLIDNMNDLTISLIGSLCKYDIIGLSILASYDDDSRNERTIGVNDSVLKTFLNSNDNDEYILTVYSIYYSAMMYSFDCNYLMTNACHHYCSNHDLITYESFLRDIATPGDSSAYNENMMKAIHKLYEHNPIGISYSDIYNELSCYEFCCFIRLLSTLSIEMDVDIYNPNDLYDYIMKTIKSIHCIDDFDYPDEFLLQAILTNMND